MKDKILYTVIAIVILLIGMCGGFLMQKTEVVEKAVPTLDNESLNLILGELEEVNTKLDAEPEEEEEDDRLNVLIDELSAVKDLKDNAAEAVEDELDDDYFEDLLKDLGYDVDEIKSYSVDDDKTKVEVLSYDFDDEDEDKAKVTLRVRVKYTLNEGVDDDYKKVLYVTGVYSLDDGDEEAELE